MAKAPYTPEQQSVRVLKVGERVRHILSELLARGEVHDDVVSAANIAVTEVRMTPRSAPTPLPISSRCWARGRTRWCTRCGRTPPSSSARSPKRLGLKFAPKLKFRKDESFAEADRIEALLRDPQGGQRPGR